jgi:hypothetical protein
MVLLINVNDIHCSGSKTINCTDRDPSAPQNEWGPKAKKLEEKKKRRDEKRAARLLQDNEPQTPESSVE